jgi:hypothetical protein
MATTTTTATWNLFRVEDRFALAASTTVLPPSGLNIQECLLPDDKDRVTFENVTKGAVELFVESYFGKSEGLDAWQAIEIYFGKSEELDVRCLASHERHQGLV